MPVVRRIYTQGTTLTKNMHYFILLNEDSINKYTHKYNQYAHDTTHPLVKPTSNKQCSM